VKKLLILDRDGVINEESAAYVKSPEEWHPIPGSLEAIALLCQRGWKITIATNQSGVGRGYYDEATLSNIHNKMHLALDALGGKIHYVFYCPHHPETGCSCRKPKVGLLEQIAAQYNLPFPFHAHSIPFVGDSIRDLIAADAAGCLPILVLSGNGQKTLENLQKESNASTESAEKSRALLAKTIVCPDLMTAVKILPLFQNTRTARCRA
jgi:D-glycero-D-manno-heptose 1,7-bisphosphate phosphatase